MGPLRQPTNEMELLTEAGYYPLNYMQRVAPVNNNTNVTNIAIIDTPGFGCGSKNFAMKCGRRVVYVVDNLLRFVYEDSPGDNPDVLVYTAERHWLGPAEKSAERQRRGVDNTFNGREVDHFIFKSNCGIQVKYATGAIENVNSDDEVKIIESFPMNKPAGWLFYDGLVHRMRTISANLKKPRFVVIDAGTTRDNHFDQQACTIFYIGVDGVAVELYCDITTASYEEAFESLAPIESDVRLGLTQMKRRTSEERKDSPKRLCVGADAADRRAQLKRVNVYARSHRHGEAEVACVRWAHRFSQNSVNKSNIRLISVDYDAVYLAALMMERWDTETRERTRVVIRRDGKIWSNRLHPEYRRQRIAGAQDGEPKTKKIQTGLTKSRPFCDINQLWSWITTSYAAMFSARVLQNRSPVQLWVTMMLHLYGNDYYRAETELKKNKRGKLNTSLAFCNRFVTVGYDSMDNITRFSAFVNTVFNKDPTVPVRVEPDVARHAYRMLKFSLDYWLDLTEDDNASSSSSHIEESHGLDIINIRPPFQPTIPPTPCKKKMAAADSIDITGLDREEVFIALYNSAKPLGLGKLHFKPGRATVQDAPALMKAHGYNGYFDYVQGRVMKVDLSGDVIDVRLYNRDNGANAAQDAITASLNTA